jgi:hypothetical protein
VTTIPKITKAEIEGERQLPESATLTEQLPENLVRQSIAAVVAAKDPELLDDLAISVEVARRDAADTGERIPLAAFMRQQGFDPAEFGLE